MNTVLGLLGVFVLFGMFSMFSNDVFAACLTNEDWADAPCFDTLPVNREEYRMAWAPYYDYKGSDWMEQKRAEMFDAENDGKLAENGWTKEDKTTTCFIIIIPEVKYRFHQNMTALSLRMISGTIYSFLHRDGCF